MKTEILVTIGRNRYIFFYPIMPLARREMGLTWRSTIQRFTYAVTTPPKQYITTYGTEDSLATMIRTLRTGSRLIQINTGNCET